jgi:hypothetical protein
MSHYRRESFDEWFLGPFTLQLFEPRLWRWGWRFEWVADRYELAKNAVLLLPGLTKPVPWHIIPVRTGWVLALPWLSLRWRRPSFRPDRSWGLD